LEYEGETLRFNDAEGSTPVDLIHTIDKGVLLWSILLRNAVSVDPEIFPPKLFDYLDRVFYNERHIF
jgi:hypothetical protein